MTLHSYILPYHNAADAFQAYADTPHSLFFDSSSQDHPDARHSYILFDPLDVLELPHTHDNPFQAAQDLLDRCALSTETYDDLPPFQGGLAGLFGYDLGRSLERQADTSQPCINMPDMAVGVYNKVIAYDHHAQKCWLTLQCCDQAQSDLILTQVTAAINARPSAAPYMPPAPQWQAQFTQNHYEMRVQQVIDYILAGDIFQANISQQFTAPRDANFTPYDHYRHLRTISPAPFSAYMNIGDTHILSISPERFLSAQSSGCISTKPIKGTAPRFPVDPAADKQSALMLRNSDKDRAENIMIADLLRNDLSKICRSDSIETPHICTIESFAHVHHLVTTITGHLAKGATPIDALRDCFPGGSITGAPKIRAMDIIDELENRRRHAYCGSLALIGANGYMDSNILIRTLIVDQDTLRFNAGGGITALSNPVDEYQEMLDKAQSILQSFAPHATQEAS